MLLYDQRSSMAQVNVDEQQILSLMDEVNSLAKKSERPKGTI